MLIIPVIDLSAGYVVHAKKGERHKYQPVQSKLTSETHPQAVLEAYFTLYPFSKIYLADLDAIQNQGDHFLLIKALSIKYPKCEFWLDAGLTPIKDQQLFLEYNNIKVIIGSETDFCEAEYKKMIDTNPNMILSLDFNQQGILNNDYLLDPLCPWPNYVIILALHRVGSNQGIDQNCLDKLKKDPNNTQLYAGGGIRNISDIQRLHEKGFRGVLTASALHNGKLTKKELEHIMAKNKKALVI